MVPADIYRQGRRALSIEDCVAMSRRMDKVLDEADPINHSYCLEVSSPGVERELTRPEHFEEYMGRPVLPSSPPGRRYARV